MHLNPCGRVVELLRFGYRTKLRPFADDDTEVTVRWYRAADDAPLLDRPTIYNSLVYNPFPHTKQSAGEVPLAPRTWSPRRVIPGLSYDHVCGTREEWSEGEAFDPDRPATLYDDNGLPTCCQSGVGGVLLGGEADYVLEPEGLLIAGTAPLAWNPGATCGAAQVIGLGQVGEAVFPGGLAEQWWELDVTPSTLYHIDFLTEDPASPFNSLRLEQGTSCSSKVGITALPDVQCFAFTTGVAATKLYVIAQGSDPMTYSFSVDSGGC